ncbi:MAG: hypothetical protein U0Z44_12015 [Kouleothrix sp.]
MFAANNLIAFGASRAIWRRRPHTIPDDLSLVTIDDLPVSMLIDPFLTAATGQPTRSAGARPSCCSIGWRTRASCPTELVLPIELIIRRSSGPAPA